MKTSASTKAILKSLESKLPKQWDLSPTAEYTLYLNGWELDVLSNIIDLCRRRGDL